MRHPKIVQHVDLKENVVRNLIKRITVSLFLFNLEPRPGDGGGSCHFYGVIANRGGQWDLWVGGGKYGG